MIECLTDPWYTVEQIDARTFAISEYGHWEKMHSYLLVGECAAALIDTGIGIHPIKRITDQLTRLPIKVITTHVHWDHIGGHSFYDEIYVHANEKDWLEHGIEKLPPMEVVRKDVIRDITLPVPDSFDIEAYEPYRGKPTGLLHDGDMIEIGDRRLTVIHTPGHSPGHICLFEKHTGYLFTGDLIYKGALYAHYPTTNPNHFVQSVQKVNALQGVTHLFPSHHQIPLDRQWLDKVNAACLSLQRTNRAKHGAGKFVFDGFEIWF